MSGLPRLTQNMLDSLIRAACRRRNHNLLLSGVDISNLDFTGSRLRELHENDAKETDTESSVILRATFRDVVCSETNFAGSLFDRPLLERVRSFDADFTDAVWPRAVIVRSEFPGANFTRSNFHASCIHRSYFHDADFVDLVANECVISDSTFQECGFHHVDLTSTDILESSVIFADAIELILEDTCFKDLSVANVYVESCDRSILNNCGIEIAGPIELAPDMEEPSPLDETLGQANGGSLNCAVRNHETAAREEL